MRLLWIAVVTCCLGCSVKKQVLVRHEFEANKTVIELRVDF